jgi:hypothetical protein
VKLLVLTAAVWPTEEEARRKLWIFLKSCERWGITPQLYGVGRTFPAYRQMCLDYQLEYLKTVTGYSHVLYTDGWDAMFTGPLDEILFKYNALDRPRILCSAFYQLGNVSNAEERYPNCFSRTIRYRYPNRGGYIAEIPVIIDAFTRMLEQPNLSGDDCLSWYDAWRDGWFRPTLDSDCRIFQIAEDDIVIPRTSRRLFNRHTRRMPCILHLSGGYTSQTTGKDERMKPWAKALGII